MRALSNIVKEFIGLYKGQENVFYTCLSMLIIILLMLVFLGDMNIDIVKDALRHMDKLMQETVLPSESLLKGTRNPALDDTNAKTLVLSLIIAGITIVNGISASIGMLSMMSWDEETGKLVDIMLLYIAVILVSGYVISAIFLSIIFSVGTVIISEVILVLTGGQLCLQPWQ